jgi:hypothetical protein
MSSTPKMSSLGIQRIAKPPISPKNSTPIKLSQQPKPEEDETKNDSGKQ